jgi:hypothetical protein
LIDEVMPALRDTEWRVLCVVVRGTLGWREGDGRKRRDWITHSQLKRRTGRASEAVSRAVQSLVRRGYLIVSDESGVELLSPHRRRRSGSRLYFQLSPAITSRARPDSVSVIEFREPKTTIENPDKESNGCG